MKPAAGGYTLAQLLCAIVVLSVIATAFLWLKSTGRTGVTRVDETRFVLGVVSQGIDLFHLDYGRVPETLDELMQPPPRPGRAAPGVYLAHGRSLLDGWGRRLVYRVPGRDGQPYDLISLGADGREGGTDADRDIWPTADSR